MKVSEDVCLLPASCSSELEYLPTPEKRQWLATVGSIDIGTHLFG